ncbi:hypothetical protein L210DRAFT_3509416 [Boletus edulis BED1]|uniref:Uncharacterized protein n=1 Tax=Boletus edulis BED1 TaxID=1328754 RepID=A0AAD4BEW5_BOLED|nr:hypothetical protein L210DRAFT_3509416 [Boletus edulis BED1]
MKLATLATLTVAVVVGHVSASPADDVLTPTGVPATSGPPFTLSFDTTGAAPSVLSALSSLISSESTAVMPYTATTLTQPASGASGSTPTQTSSSPSSTATQTSGAGSLGRVWRSGDVAVVGFAVLGAVAALVC